MLPKCVTIRGPSFRPRSRTAWSREWAASIDRCPAGQSGDAGSEAGSGRVPVIEVEQAPEPLPLLDATYRAETLQYRRATDA